MKTYHNYFVCVVIVAAMIAGCNSGSQTAQEGDAKGLHEDSVAIGMTRDEVIRTLGKPARSMGDPEIIEELYYLVPYKEHIDGKQLGGLNITVEKQFVIAVEPFYTVRDTAIPP